MLTPLEFMTRYRNLTVDAAIDDPVARMSRLITARITKYFMMDWTAGTHERADYNTVTSGSDTVAWFKANKERIRNAAMGKGAPGDYELALSWAVRSKKIPVITQTAVQAYCDQHLGID